MGQEKLTIDDLPVEIILQIASHLNLSHSLAFAITCKFFYGVSQEPALQKVHLKKHFHFFS